MRHVSEKHLNVISSRTDLVSGPGLVVVVVGRGLQGQVRGLETTRAVTVKRRGQAVRGNYHRRGRRRLYLEIYIDTYI